MTTSDPSVPSPEAPQVLAGARRELRFFLDGQAVVLDDVDPRDRLIDYLRAPEVGRAGTKLVCGEGGCGACTVMLSGFDPTEERVVDRAVNACLRPLCAVDGMAVTTTQGIGSTRDVLSPVQYAIAARYGSQCGYCTPGFVMNLFTRLREGTPTTREVEDLFDGHLCRCTGYRAIYEASKGFASDFDPADYRTNHPCEVPRGSLQIGGEPASLSLPPTLASGLDTDALHFARDGVQWFRPTCLPDVQTLKAHYETRGQEVKLVGGNTSSGVYKDEHASVLIDVSRVPELLALALEGERLRVGAAVTIQQLIRFAEALLPQVPEARREGLEALIAHAEKIGNLQVRNVGSLAGNIWMARAHVESGNPFPSDLFTVLVGLGATATLAERGPGIDLLEIPGPEALAPGDLIVDFEIPLSAAGATVRSYKVARRIQDSHAIVNAGFQVVQDEAGAIAEARIVYGGLASFAFRAAETERLLCGRVPDEATLSESLALLRGELAKHVGQLPDSDFFPEHYRLDLAVSLFFKFYRALAGQELAGEDRPLSSSARHVQIYDDELPVSQPLVKLAGFSQAAGEASYVQDLAPPARCLEGAYVLGRHAHARFEWEGSKGAVEAGLRRRFPGVHALITAEDVPGSNISGMGGDEPIFAAGEVTCWGQPVGLVVAETVREAQQAVGWLEESGALHYTEMLPVIADIDDARRAPGGPSYFPDSGPNQHIAGLIRPGSNRCWLADPSVPEPGCELLHGTHRAADQAHFYLETQSVIAIREETDNLLLHSSTQNPSGVQSQAAKALGIPTAHVQLRVRRLGGGFGGKQHRASFMACAAAVAAWKLSRPVRLVLDRNTDQTVVGKRHPFLGEFQVSYTREGDLRGLAVTLWSDGGISYDCSFPVMDLAQQSADCCYRIPTMSTAGHVCRTNNASNTGFRSFGTIQATQIVEEALERVAHAVGERPEHIRERHLYRDRNEPPFDTTHYAQELRGSRLQEIWSELKQSAELDARREAVAAFNREHPWRKRGLSMLPVKYGIGYFPRLLDQAGAHVSVYTDDGSVMLRHGGIEIGQGLDTKMAQIAARELCIPLEFIRIGEMLTSTVPNSTATAASSGADLNGGAVQNACRELRTRLEHYADENGVPRWIGADDPAKQWAEVVSGAWAARVDLAVQGFFRTPFLPNLGEPDPYGHVFPYFAYGAAVSEVEIDVLTGEFWIPRADILYDAGRSLNPCLDVGQIEGGFVQGIGNVTTEELLYLPDGRLLSDGTWDYKPPCSKTIPVDFRVSLLRRDRINHVTGDPADPAAVQSSKGVGEPPFVLANSVFFAIKHAVVAARRDGGDTSWPEFDAPATVGRIQAACRVDPSRMRLGGR